MSKKSTSSFLNYILIGCLIVMCLKIYFNSEVYNLKCIIADENGNVVSWASAGQKGFKGSRKSTPYAAQIAAAIERFRVPSVRGTEMTRLGSEAERRRRASEGGPVPTVFVWGDVPRFVVPAPASHELTAAPAAVGQQSPVSPRLAHAAFAAQDEEEDKERKEGGEDEEDEEENSAPAELK